MSYQSSWMDLERRRDPRVRLEMFLNQYVQDHPRRTLAVNVSDTGLFVQKLIEPVVEQPTIVGLEFELPGTGEVIWASAESRFDSFGDYFHISGLRFVAMARKHERLLRDFVTEKRLRDLRWIRNNRVVVPS
jgi:hypothetical protein